MRPYISITDFTDAIQVDHMQSIFTSNMLENSDRILGVGVMMSYKTLHGIPTKWADVFPENRKIVEIFSRSGVFNCLHYADYDDDTPGLDESLIMAIEYGGENMSALQLDMFWPDPESLSIAIDSFEREFEVILQLGRSALDESSGSLDTLLKRLAGYAGVIDRVLLDKSQGQGIGMDAVGLLPYIQSISENFPWLGIGVAGGLGPERMHLALPILEDFPQVSFDAQGRLRPSGNALDPIDWELAGKYLVEALKLCE